MSYKYLSQEEVQQLLFDWRYRGFSTMTLLTEEEVDELNDEMERLRTERAQTSKEDGSEWGEWDPFIHPHRESEIITKYFAHPKLIEAAEVLFGNEVEGTQSWVYFKPPGQLGRDMHQNAFYIGCNHNEVLNFAIALDNHDDGNGSVWTLEGSHRLPTLPIEIDEERAKTNPKNWRNERGKPCVLPEGHNFPKVEGRVKKGDVVILHSHTVHGSEPNNSDRMRRSLLYNYVQKGINFKQGNHMKRERYDLYDWRDQHWK